MEKNNALNNIRGIQRMTIVGAKDIRRQKDTVQLFDPYGSAARTSAGDSEVEMEILPHLQCPRVQVNYKDKQKTSSDGDDQRNFEFPFQYRVDRR